MARANLVKQNPTYIWRFSVPPAGFEPATLGLGDLLIVRSVLSMAYICGIRPVLDVTVGPSWLRLIPRIAPRNVTRDRRAQRRRPSTAVDDLVVVGVLMLLALGLFGYSVVLGGRWSRARFAPDSQKRLWGWSPFR